jgi:fructose-1,6-bisphosphatase II / sedoheptulose-1,7-bisphosphatase
MTDAIDHIWSEATQLAQKATEAAAKACFPWIGKGDKIAADGAAVSAISELLNASNFEFSVAIGEGELDEAPMLSVGDRLGTAGQYTFDVAVDPLEGTTLCSLGLKGSISAIAFGTKDSLLSAPDSYMLKLMAGPKCPDELVDVDLSLGDVIAGYSAAVGKNISEVIVCVLDKPRHAKFIDQIVAFGAKVLKIPDADIPAALWVCDPDKSGVDLYWGIGGGPEGVISAAALRCLGGKMSARFRPQNADQLRRLCEINIDLIDRKFSLLDMVKGEAILSISSITGSRGMAPIKQIGGKLHVESICISSRKAAGA